jgi:uncharacterized protein (DUF2249 family)
MITAQTRMGTVLDTYPKLVDILAGYHPHFGKLRNRLLRKVMAARVTVADAAHMAGIAPERLLDVMRRAVGEPDPAVMSVAEPAVRALTPMPPALRSLDDDHRMELDVRADIARGEEPFARIMGAVKALGPRDALVLRAPFEPMPLYDVLGRRGFAHWTERLADDDWRIWFWREAGPAPAPTARAVAPTADGPLTLDVRGLEPPEPMVLVLSRLDGLASGETLEILHDRRPLFLYPQLEARGFAHDTDQPEPGLVRIRVRRAETPS